MSRVLIGVLLGLLCSAPGRAAAPGAQLQFVDLPSFNSQQNPRWGPVLTDIVNHEAPGDSNPYDSLVTKGHETSHGIHAYIRNHLESPVSFAALPGPWFPMLIRRRSTVTAERANGFYVLANRAVRVREPNIRKSHVIPYVPASLRGPRYQTYVVGQTAWDDTPLYLWDEWTAYVNGGLVGVDLVDNGLWTYPWQDAMYGPLEFTVYALATAMAVKDRDPAYFTAHTQFREFLAFNAGRAMGAFARGATMPAFKYDKQDQYLHNLRTSADAESMRVFTRAQLGEEWTRTVFGF
jgi:hypothetical protein